MHRRFFNSMGWFQETFVIVYCSHTTNYGHRTGPWCRQQLRAKAASSCMKGGPVDWKDFSIPLDGFKKNLPSCTAATPLTTAIEPAHVAANNCVQKLQVAAWRGEGGTGHAWGGPCAPPPSCSKGDEKRRACMKGLSQTSTTSRSLDSYVSATP